MKNFVSFLAVLFVSFPLLAQFQIGETVIDFNDPSRSRDIETHIYYPADAAGVDVAISSGEFPIVSVGHGFSMNYDSYNYLWEHLVPLGYIVALPATESGITVSHGDFGLDVAFVITALQARNADMSSTFYQSVGTTSAVMGHSMGGGASFIAAESNSSITTMITMAAAETTPSAIAAASNISMPSLTFTGDEDCVAPEAGNQLDMYNNLSDCKAYATILGGGHCQFANSNFICELGEITCIGANYIAEADQHNAITGLITPWLAAWLKDDYSAWQDFEALEGSGTNFNLALTCSNNAPQPPMGNAPSAGFSSNDTGDGQTNYTDESTDMPSSWSWDFGDGDSSSDQNPMHTYTANGTYNVCLTVTNANGSDLFCDSITVNSIMTDIDDLVLDQISFSPMPAQDVIYVQINSTNTELGFTIYSLEGKVLETGAVVNKEISIAHLPNALYLLQFNNKEGLQTVAQKMLKQ